MPEMGHFLDKVRDWHRIQRKGTGKAEDSFFFFLSNIALNEGIEVKLPPSQVSPIDEDCLHMS